MPPDSEMEDQEGRELWKFQERRAVFQVAQAATESPAVSAPREDADLQRGMVLSEKRKATDMPLDGAKRARLDAGGVPIGATATELPSSSFDAPAGRAIGATTSRLTFLPRTRADAALGAARPGLVDFHGYDFEVPLEGSEHRRQLLANTLEAWARLEGAQTRAAGVRDGTMQGTVVERLGNKLGDWLKAGLPALNAVNTGLELVSTLDFIPVVGNIPALSTIRFCTEKLQACLESAVIADRTAELELKAKLSATRTVIAKACKLPALEQEAAAELEYVMETAITLMTAAADWIEAPTMMSDAKDRLLSATKQMGDALQTISVTIQAVAFDNVQSLMTAYEVQLQFHPSNNDVQTTLLPVAATAATNGLIEFAPDGTGAAPFRDARGGSIVVDLVVTGFKDADAIPKVVADAIAQAAVESSDERLRFILSAMLGQEKRPVVKVKQSLLTPERQEELRRLSLKLPAEDLPNLSSWSEPVKATLDTYKEEVAQRARDTLKEARNQSVFAQGVGIFVWAGARLKEMLSAIEHDPIGEGTLATYARIVTLYAIEAAQVEMQLDAAFTAATNAMSAGGDALALLEFFKGTITPPREIAPGTLLPKPGRSVMDDGGSGVRKDERDSAKIKVEDTATSTVGASFATLARYV